MPKDRVLYHFVIVIFDCYLYQERRSKKIRADIAIELGRNSSEKYYAKYKEEKMKMKNKKFQRVISWLLVFVMILSLQPFSAMPVKAAGEMNVTLHFNNSWGWATPAIQHWGGTIEVLDGGETKEIPGWGGAQGTDRKSVV